MKRIVVLLATLLLSFGLINAGDVAIQFGGPGYESDTLRAFLDAEIQVTWDCDFDVFGASIGLEIFDGDATGAGWLWVDKGGYGDASGCVTTYLGDGIDINEAMDMTDFTVTEQDIDELLVDTIMAGGVANKVGVPTGGPYHLYDYNFQATIPDPSDELFVGMLCVDSCFVPPAGAFVFVTAGGTAVPSTFGGEICAPVTKARNFCPTWDAVLGNDATNHCDDFEFTVAATDPEDDDVAYWGTHDGAGNLVPDGGGAFTYEVDDADVAGSPVSITMYAHDPAYHGPSACVMMTFDLDVQNTAPVVDCGEAFKKTGANVTFTKNDIVGSDDDACDGVEYSLAGVTPATTYTATIGLLDGAFSWATDMADTGTVFTFTVEVTDGFTTGQCSFDVEVLGSDPFLIEIAKTHQSFQGHFIDVDITYVKGSEDFGGFDFLIGYDASALAFTEAELGAALVTCGWEYFTYRYNWNGNCGNACPSGLVRLVGLAETNNGPNHPTCTKPAQGEALATLTFYLSNDRTLECQYLPIYFYWMDCGDNTMASIGGDTLWASDQVFWHGFFDDPMGTEISDFGGTFPTGEGMPDDPCITEVDPGKTPPLRKIDFANGGIDVACADSIDARGDINLNGVANEIADAVMFTNYFINGLSAFPANTVDLPNQREGAIAASDVNADGIALSVADLVYLVRVIIGDANPYPKLMPDALAEIDFQHNDITMSAPIDVGAALFTFQVNGEVGTPALAEGINMDMKYAVNGSELRVLVYNIGTNAIPAGDDNVIVNVPGNVELVSAEVAAYDGFGIDAMIRNLPASFAVKNYPNPFNPQTTIALDLPVSSDWSVKIYNVAGQLVKDYSGYSEAGTLNVVWDGSDNNNSFVASGIYFYKVEASQYSVTKKMMLMK